MQPSFLNFKGLRDVLLLEFDMRWVSALVGYHSPVIAPLLVVTEYVKNTSLTLPSVRELANS